MGAGARAHLAAGAEAMLRRPLTGQVRYESRGAQFRGYMYPGAGIWSSSWSILIVLYPFIRPAWLPALFVQPASLGARRQRAS